MIHVFEVGPRDGLQNEKHLLSLDDKVWFIESLVDAGIRGLEVGAFVRNDKVPQMADSGSLPEKLAHITNADFYYLVPNLTGLKHAISNRVKNIAVFSAVSNSFNQNNIGMTVDESFLVMKEIVTEAKAQKMNVRGYVSTVWGCPFEGRVTPSMALPVIERMLALPIDQVSLGDTIGVAAPTGVQAILKPLLASHDQKRLAVHFHDTRGTALANALRSFELGITAFDASAGGLGGCNFAPGASGNLATEDLAYFFKEMGVETGINYRKLCETSIELARRMGGRHLPSHALKAYQSNCAVNNAWDI
jgi:hydroxymethylglutaryl-CoA lyase